MATEHPNSPNDDGCWVTITELAERKGLGKAAVSERVSRFEAQGLIETRPGKGRTKLVNLAEFDRAAGQVTDLGREQGAATRRQAGQGGERSDSTDPVYTREQARRMAYQADREKLSLGEQLHQLVPIDRLRSETGRLFGPVVTVIDRLDSRAELIATAVGQGGTPGARQVLKALKVELRNAFADAFEGLVAELAREPARTLDDFEPRSADLPGDAVPAT